MTEKRSDYRRRQAEQEGCQQWGAETGHGLTDEVECSVALQ